MRKRILDSTQKQAVSDDPNWSKLPLKILNILLKLHYCPIGRRDGEREDWEIKQSDCSFRLHSEFVESA